ncbi:hypothetical protein ACXR6G_14360 [Ancylomarina sp. YFZ004]
MENLETQESENRNELVLEIQAEVFLRETRKWAKFLSIVGFIFIAALASIGIFAASSMMSAYTAFPVGGLAFFYLIILGLYFFPLYYLLKFANTAKEALNSRNTQTLTESMKYIKSHYKFVGILTIVMLALYPIGIIIAIIVGANQGF